MTQEYTPVSWQDETTSQQGTLINAERLNQMQTAHHYADGFEEVDTAPTADPGVGYHKVVYCTADSTFYRWDGTQWQKDIDDDTKALLLAHEADHANPHQVTKAQVGLGNADNTSDADKPVSTATQTALNAKADKSDTYTKAQVDTALATKADKATTYTKTETDTLLGAKADKATTYTKTEADTLLAGKADKATTLAGYGITDAYTKTEADTLLGAKANDDAVVHKAGTETITGAKTFTEVVSFNRLIGLIRHDFSGIEYGVTAATWNSEIYRDKNNVEIGRQALIVDTNKTSWMLRAKNGNSNMDLGLDSDASGPYAFAPSPGSGAPSNAVATIATLDGYTPMVRTTGNQTIAGVKTFTSIPAIVTESAHANIIYLRNNNITQADQTGGHNSAIAFRGASDALLARFRYRNGVIDNQPARNVSFDLYDASGTAHTFEICRLINNTTESWPALDAYTPMVRTTGNQTISGTKTFTGPISAASMGKNMRFYNSTEQRWIELARLPWGNTNRYVLNINGSVNGADSLCYGKLMVLGTSTSFGTNWIIRKNRVANGYLSDPNRMAVIPNGTHGTGYLSVYMKMNTYWGIDMTLEEAKVQAEYINPNTVLFRGEFTATDLNDISTLNPQYPTDMEY